MKTILIRMLVIFKSLQVGFGFRSFEIDFNPKIYQKSCPTYNQYWPGIHPYMCAGTVSTCYGIAYPTQIIHDGYEVFCHPQIQGYNLYYNSEYFTHLAIGPSVLIYNVDQNENIIITTEYLKLLYYCIIGQKYNGIYKCQYCNGVNVGVNCTTSPYPVPALPCGQNCLTCLYKQFVTCYACIDGYSPLNSEDFYCSLKCQTGGRQCSENSDGYSVQSCLDGYELLDGQCVECPIINCKVCTLGVCSECKWPYSLKFQQCFVDWNCMKQDYVYNDEGLPIDTDCLQCDIGYFKKGTKCSFCQDEIGLENCFICKNENECISCFATHYLTVDKKCEPFIECNEPCLACLATDPNYCTICDHKQKFLTARIVPGQCVCDAYEGYAELNGECIQFQSGYCQTCDLKFEECLSCSATRNRGLIGKSCPCLLGYYDTGLEDKICQKCYFSCYSCSGTSDNECTDCGDPNIYKKQLIGGKCLCDVDQVERFLSNGLTQCQSCHPRCEKCQALDNNSQSQQCTMCRSGQNRIVSDELNCECKEGYGEDGIVDICFSNSMFKVLECHYSCISCNGPLFNNCTKCSSESNRYLTLQNECKCNRAYFDNGTNDIVCYLGCHNSCLDCNNPAEDQCTSCPSTRQPDRIGSTFKCLCKDSHQFSNESSLECLECHFTCKTCNGQYITNCLSCDINFRQLIFTRCNCNDGYYDIGQLQCSKCYYTCTTCYGPEFDNCISCSTVNNRIVKANQCLCKDGHLEKQSGDLVCSSCSYRCASCTDYIDKCDQCPNYSFRDLGSDNSCLCPLKYYDEPGNPICIPCHYSCLTCNGIQSNQCSTCYTYLKRQIDNQSQCQCVSQYFDNGQAECQPCSIYCLDCKQSYDNCTSCKSDKYLEGTICKCKTKLQGYFISTYLNQFKTKCQPCHYTCLTCTGPSSEECDSCWDQDNRIQQGTTCVCNSNSFDNNQPKCSQCNFGCQTCAITDNFCLSCPPLSLRVLIYQTCQCPEGYFDEGTNPICQKCHYSCKTCSSKATNCITCSITSNRQFISILNSCICNNYYYDVGVDVCQQCHYSCLSCLGQESYQCKTCHNYNLSYRVYNGGICQCIMGYYDDEISAYCKQCLVQCLTCQYYSYNCTSCSNTRHLNGNTCDCDLHHYESGQETCGKCDENCLNCKINPQYCTECDLTQFRVLDNITNQCICQIGTTDINGICQSCDISCYTCLHSLTFCTSCDKLKYLQNNQCFCVEGTYEIEINKECKFCSKTCLTCINIDNHCLSCSSDDFRILQTGNQCVCQDGYFEDQSQQCQKCDISCLTCESTSKYCLSCDPFLNLQLSYNNLCICQPNFYFNIQTKQCEVCNITCKECDNAFQCLECESITRYYDPESLKCPCKDGFYETNQKQCQQCDITCQTCINQSTKCLTCESIYFRILNNSNQCLCKEGYYDVGIEMCQKCNNLCKTCQITSTSCKSCYEVEQIRILNGNQCLCQPGYFDQGQIICEKCSKSCLTCQGQKYYCTSCDISQNRIDQSPIHKCPCLSNFYQDENEVCQKCHIKCAGCISSRDNCLSCQTSQTSYRLTITQNCNCKDGYFDDGIQFQCQKCNYQCKTCILTPSNCIICQTSLRQGPPVCACKSGYFESEQKVCEQCDNQCSTCEKQSSNCIICKGGRINKQCDCQDGYFEAGQQDCIQCDFKCFTCKYNQSNCLVCKGNRIKDPICNCEDGFYDDHQSINCLICDENCRTCTLEGCLTCHDNRILSNENTCECPQNSISHPNTQWCSNCEIAVLDIRLSDDLLSIIVGFDYPLNPNYFQIQTFGNICFNFLADQTLNLLGNDPFCFLNQDDNKYLIFQLGHNSKIIPGDQIIFLSNTFGHIDCQIKISLFIYNQVQFPINPVSPQIEYEIPQYLLNPCEDNLILYNSTKQDGFRSLINISWSYLIEGLNGQGNLDEFVQYQTILQQLHLIIPLQTLPKQSKITFYVEFENFVKQKAQQQIVIQTHSGQIPSVFFQKKKKYFTLERIVLMFNIQKKDCLGTINNDQSGYQVSLFEIQRNDSNSRSSRVNFSQLISQNQFNVTIQKYTLTPKTTYTFQMITQEPSTNIQIDKNFTIDIEAIGIKCLFNGTKKIQNYRKDLIISIYCRDFDTLYEWNQDPGIIIQVSCLDLTQDTACKDLNKKIINVNKTDSIQFIPKLTVKPFSIWSWTVVALKQKNEYSFKQNIIFLDDDFKFLDVNFSLGYIIRPINNYETLQFDYNIPFEDRYNLLLYSLALIYDFQLVKILEPQYAKYHFRLYDHFQFFNKGNQINVKFLAQFTNNIIPSSYDIQLTLNQPPNCQINLSSKTVQALKLIKAVANCYLSDDSPFSYQLRFFLFEQDYIDFKNSQSDYSLILYSFQRSNLFDIYLPESVGVALIQIMDEGGSMSNVEQYLNITKSYYNCSDLLQNNLNFNQLIILLLDIKKNHHNEPNCAQLSISLIEIVKKYLDSEELFDQILAIQNNKTCQTIHNLNRKFNYYKQIINLN